MLTENARPPLPWTVTRTNSTPLHTSRGLAGHPRNVKMGLGIIKRGYLLQFARRHPCFSGVVPTLVGSKDAHVLHSKVKNLLAKTVVEKVPLAQRKSGFYSPYFPVPNKDGSLRPIVDLRHLNRALMKRTFRMTTLKQILAHILSGDWFF